MSKKATLAEKYDVAMHCSGLGDSLFSRGLWEEAKKPYETAINQICFSTDAELVDLLGILHSKVAAVNLRQNYFWKVQWIMITNFFLFFLDCALINFCLIGSSGFKRSNR